MATDFPVPSAEPIEFPNSSVLTQPLTLLRSAMSVAIPALLDVCCIVLACSVAILLYHLYRPLDDRGAWLLWAQISLEYGAAFLILAQAQQLYTQRATLLQVANT